MTHYDPHQDEPDTVNMPFQLITDDMRALLLAGMQYSHLHQWSSYGATVQLPAPLDGPERPLWARYRACITCLTLDMDISAHPPQIAPCGPPAPAEFWEPRGADWCQCGCPWVAGSPRCTCKGTHGQATTEPEATPAVAVHPCGHTPACAPELYSCTLDEPHPDHVPHQDSNRRGAVWVGDGRRVVRATERHRVWAAEARAVWEMQHRGEQA